MNKEHTPSPQVKEAVDAPVCAICGKPILSNSTIDHVIPQAIYKWHENYLGRDEFVRLRRSITSPRTTVRTHRRCNERKEESIVTISSLHVSRNKRSKLWKTYHSVEPYIEAFLQNKAALLEKQHQRCFLCGIPLKDGGVLRRVDDSIGRTWDNACLICHRCNCRVKSKDVKMFRLHHKNLRRGPRRPRQGQRLPRPDATAPAAGAPAKEASSR